MPFYEVAPGVGLIDLWQVNVYVLYGNGDAVVIDTGMIWDSKPLLRAIRTGLPPGTNISAIIQTHGHCDHAGNTAFLAKQFGAEVIAHELEAPFIEKFQTYMPSGWRRISLKSLVFLLGEIFIPVRRCRVDRKVREGDTINTPIGPLSVVHTPGHTLGHMSLWHEGNRWLFSGDAVINVIPFIRRTALCLPVPLFSLDVKKNRASAKKLAALKPTALFAQHGNPLLSDADTALTRFTDEFEATNG